MSLTGVVSLHCSLRKLHVHATNQLGVFAGDGTWRVGTIEPQRASVTPRDLWVIRERDGQGTLLQDIVFGDVFIFSGQSNIDIPEAYGHQVAPLRADPSQSGETAQLAEEQLA